MQAWRSALAPDSSLQQGLCLRITDLGQASLQIISRISLGSLLNYGFAWRGYELSRFHCCLIHVSVRRNFSVVLFWSSMLYGGVKGNVQRFEMNSSMGEYIVGFSREKLKSEAL